MNKFYLHTFGCKVNQSESQGLRELLLSHDYKETSREDASYVIVNTCTVTKDADKSLRKFINSTKKINPQAKIILLGCYPQLRKNSLPEGIYACFGNREKYYLVNFLKKGRINSLNKNYPFLNISYFKSHTRAFVKIQDGCDNRCSFCSVWQARGKSSSRKSEEVIEEVKRLIDNGYKEIVLTGICLGSYGKDLSEKINLSSLLKMLFNLKAKFRIRLSSINIEDITPDLLKIMKLPHICPHLHIPLQSGSDKILRLMNRKYNYKEFEEIIFKLKKIANFEFSTDVIVGFPQETEEDFHMTIEALRRLSPIRVHIFPFSPRPHTLAEKLNGKLSPHVIMRRKRELMEIAKRIVKSQMEKYLNKELIVLLEQNYTGYSQNYIKTEVRDANFKNRFLKVRIKKIKENNIAEAEFLKLS